MILSLESKKKILDIKDMIRSFLKYLLCLSPDMMLIGWWFVHVEEQQGWVPSTYLERRDGSKDLAFQKYRAGEGNIQYIHCLMVIYAC